MLAIQLEVVARIILNFVAHKMQSDNNEGKWGRINRIALLGSAICSLQTLIPTVIVVAFGASVVNLILKVIPEWVTNGLSIAVAFGYFKIQLEKAEIAAAVSAAGTVDEMGDDNYYNSTTVMSSMILGATLAIEEKDGIQAKETVQSLKTSFYGMG